MGAASDLTVAVYRFDTVLRLTEARYGFIQRILLSEVPYQ